MPPRRTSRSARADTGSGAPTNDDAPKANQAATGLARATGTTPKPQDGLKRPLEADNHATDAANSEMKVSNESEPSAKTTEGISTRPTLFQAPAGHSPVSYYSPETPQIYTGATKRKLDSGSLLDLFGLTEHSQQLPSADVTLYSRKVFDGVSSIRDYTLHDKVGEGTFGEVSIANNLRTNAKVALKKILIHKDRDGIPITALREIKILKSLRHPNIIELREIAFQQGNPENWTPGVIYMVFPYMDHDLAGILGNPDIILNPAQIKSFALQMVEGIRYLHINSIIHRDLKSANILISKRGDLKIADFGLARYYNPRVRRFDLTPTVVTLWYRPPELLFCDKSYGKPVDIWGLGCIFAELWTRRALFPGDSDGAVLREIYQIMGPPQVSKWPKLPDLCKRKGVALPQQWSDETEARIKSRKLHDAFAKHLDETTISLIELMLVYNPDDRPTAAQVLQHAYFKTEPRAATPGSNDFPDWVESHELSSRQRRKQREQQSAGSGRQQLVWHTDIVRNDKGEVIPRRPLPL